MTNVTNAENEYNDVSEDVSESQGPYSMTEESLQHRLLTKDSGKRWPQLYALTIACLSSVSQGTVLGWSAAAVNTLSRAKEDKAEITMNVRNFAWICSLAPLGCSLGVVVWSYFNIRTGPRKTMLIQAPFLCATWIALSFVHKIELTHAGRFFTGFLSYCYMVCGETLLQDCVHVKNLRYMMILYRSFVKVGILISYFMGFIGDAGNFTGLSAVIVGIHFAMLYFAPESPVYLYAKSQKKAERAVIWYRGNTNIVMDMRELKRISDLRNLDPGTYKYMLVAKVVLKGLFIVLGLTIFQVFTGYYLIMFYNLLIFKDSTYKVTSDSVNAVSKFVDALIIGLVFLTSKVVALLVHNSVRFGTRKLLILSGLLTGLCLALIATFNAFRFVYPNILSRYKWFNLISAIGVIISYEIGFGEYPEIILFHYMPHQIYPRAKLIVSCVHWFLCFVLIQCFIRIQEGILYSYIMIFFLAFCCLCSTVYTKFFVVEFKNETLVSIQLQLGGNPIGTRGASRFAQY